MIEDVYVLSPLQEGIYYHWLSSDLKSEFVYQISYCIEASLDLQKIKEAYEKLILRHGVLRTFFTEDFGDRILQVVVKDVDPNFVYIDTSDNISFSLSSYKDQDLKQGFNLQKASQMRLTVIHLKNNTYELIWSYHHIIMDGWCMFNLVSDFFQIYEALFERRDCKLKTIRPYSDYIKWLESVNKEASLRYWQEYLYGHDSITEFPGKLQVSNSRNDIIDGFSLRLNLQDCVKLRSVCTELGITENVFIQCAWGILLARYTFNNDVVFGSVVSGRPGELIGIEDMVGLFINTIPVRIHLKKKDRVLDLLNRMQKEFISSIPHHYVQLASIQSQHSRANKLFDHIIQFQNFPINESKDSILNGGERIMSCTDQKFLHNGYDLTAIVNPHDCIDINFIYNSLAFDKSFISRFGQYLINLLKVMVENVFQDVETLNFLDQHEVDRLVYGFNATEVSYPEGESVVSLFESSAALYGDLPAVVYGDRELSYRDLNGLANQVSYHLRTQHGVGDGALIGIVLDRSEWMVIAILGVLKAGGAYVPIDPGYPQSRIDYLIQDSCCQAIITQADYIFNFSNFEGSLYAIDIEINSEDTCFENVPARISSSDLAYVIYTSGSTGEPKGVMVEHGNLVNYVLWSMDFYLGNVSGGYFGVPSSLSFDLTVTSIYSGLLSGSGLYIYGDGTDTADIVRDSLRGECGVGSIKLTPSHVRLLGSLDSFKGSVGRVILGGEEVFPSDVKLLSSVIDGVSLYNEYGPTEATVGCMVKSLEPGSGVTLGLPISNTWVYILDGNMGVVPEGCLGEIYIGGAGVSRGYLNRPDLTSLRFVADPYRPGERLYRTGDLGVRLSGGEIEYRGRMDDQVKVRGYRIELGEVDRFVQSCSGILGSVTVAREVNGGDRELVSYIVSSVPVDVGALRAELGELVPSYMVPSRYVELSELPLTPNGKVDRKSLPDPEEGVLGTGTEYVGARNAVESLLVSIWEEVLGRSGIGIHDNFFILGGDSIKSIQVVSRLRQGGYGLGIQDILRFPTIFSLSGLVVALSREPFQGVETGTFGLSPIQHLFFEEIQVDRHHYNQSVMLSYDGVLLEDGIRFCLGSLMRHHDSLRYVYREGPSGWFQENSGDAVPLLDVVSIGDDADLVAHCEQLQGEFSLSGGPLFRGCIFSA
ncbi:amino acid adenylation domain-containing protein [Sphingobacterium sp. ML3W]|uniref:non-ribosomal peptide synthetase n=1 Tax=Sphingobacterium sp. ML3W TaxID=1538644 RepID=UPI003008D44A